jgi:branched-subunit amino acid transport protein
MRHRTRRKLAILVLAVGLPIYIVVAVNLVELLDRPPIVVEFLVYVVLGIVWALPLKALFRGVGRADPDDERGDGR